MTAELKCSDGPWSVEGREITDCIGRRIALVSGDPKNPREVPVMQANAAMMGAARALYEALEPFLADYLAGRECFLTGEPEHYTRALAAMAQARGELS